MKYKLLLAFAFTGSLILSPSAFAGKWVTGQGETIQEAIEAAIAVGEARVRSRNEGCVDGTQRGLKQIDIGGVKVWEVQVYTHNHNGSCGINANEAWAKEVAADLARSLSQ